MLKIALHKDGYEDADEEISAEGEHVVLIKLNKQIKEDSVKLPIKPDVKKDPGPGKKKNDPVTSGSDVVKPEPVKPEPTKPEPIKPQPIKPEPVKPEPIKPEPIKKTPKAKPPKGNKKKKKIVVF